jgi:tripartite-type tricarboxylate transporter receptor subunit TctC
MRALFLAVPLAACVAAAPALAAAADSTAKAYPTKPVRFILGQATGGGQDIISRALALKLSETMGHSVIVDNRPGAAGTLAAAIASKAAPDGYTVLIVSSTFSINPALYKKLPYDPKKDLLPVTLFAKTPFILLVHPGVPAKSVKELIAYAKERPGELNYASGGVGNSGHLAAELFSSLAGVRMTHIPYKGTGLAMPDLLGGRVHILFNSLIQALPYVKRKQLTVLGVTTTHRTPLLPDVPAIAESGLPGYEFSSWYGLTVPAGTPRPIIDRLNAEVLRVLKDPGFRQQLSSDGSEPLGTTPAEFGAFLSSEMKRWAAVVKSSGMRVE